MTSHTDFLADVDRIKSRLVEFESLLRDCYSYIAHDTPATDEMLQRISEMRADNHTIEERKEWAKMVLKLRQALGIKISEAKVQCPDATSACSSCGHAYPHYKWGGCSDREDADCPACQPVEQTRPQEHWEAAHEALGGETCDKCGHFHEDGSACIEPQSNKESSMDEIKYIRRIAELERQRDALTNEADKYKALAKSMSVTLSNIRNCDITPECSRREAQQALEDYVRGLSSATPCCDRDHDKDGNCDKHPEGIRLSDEERRAIYEKGKEISRRRLSEMDNASIIAAINAHQSNPNVHPLTCGNDSGHAPLVPVVSGGRVVLFCTDCLYEQEHIPPLFPTAKIDLED